MPPSPSSSTREKPILFSGEMVRAILDGRKTQTRRVVRPLPAPPEVTSVSVDFDGVANFTSDEGTMMIACPYGSVGDRLWVRESALYMPDGDFTDVKYADDEEYELCIPSKREAFNLGWKLRPSIHMPRWASRITLEITGVRVERLQQLTMDDAVAEGTLGDNYLARQNYFQFWNSLNAKRGFSAESNPWVWVIEFRRIPNDN